MRTLSAELRAIDHLSRSYALTPNQVFLLQVFCLVRAEFGKSLADYADRDVLHLMAAIRRGELFG